MKDGTPIVTNVEQLTPGSMYKNKFYSVNTCTINYNLVTEQTHPDVVRSRHN